MGVAAYNRGSKLMSSLIDAGSPSHEAMLFTDLSEHSARLATRRVFCPTVVRFGPLPGEVSLMNRKANGWASSCFSYKSLWTLFREWRLVVIGTGKDEHGSYLAVHPI